jgi:SAM-dependent methyltransferase
MPTQTLRDIERESIRAFLVEQSEYLTGDVLDYGCGKQPYRDIVSEAGGVYVGYDRSGYPANVSGRDVYEGTPLSRDWDAVMVTQVLQYVPRPEPLLNSIRLSLRKRNGHLVMTYPTCWPEVEDADLHRFTRSGMERLLRLADMRVVTHVSRANLKMGGELFTVGYGVVASPA